MDAKVTKITNQLKYQVLLFFVAFVIFVFMEAVGR
jgi:hypothetical protein